MYKQNQVARTTKNIIYVTFLSEGLIYIISHTLGVLLRFSLSLAHFEKMLFAAHKTAPQK
jgi:hypothetical protein